MPTEESDVSPDFRTIESHAFHVDRGVIFIGKERIKKDFREVLRDDARFLQNSRLWEVFNATIINECADLALIQSTNFDHVEFAKALYHWRHVMENAIHTLAKD
jgi:hypothetical protein